MKNSKLVKFSRVIQLPIIVIVIVWFALSFVSNRLAWKAVFLDSNQVYFGRFSYIPFRSTITLRDAHFLKSDTTAPGATADAPIMTIMSVESDAHAPTSDIVIEKSHILYYQELRPGTSMYQGLSERVGE